MDDDNPVPVPPTISWYIVKKVDGKYVAYFVNPRTGEPTSKNVACEGKPTTELVHSAMRFLYDNAVPWRKQ